MQKFRSILYWWFPFDHSGAVKSCDCVCDTVKNY